MLVQAKVYEAPTRREGSQPWLHIAIIWLFFKSSQAWTLWQSSQNLQGQTQASAFFRALQVILMGVRAVNPDLMETHYLGLNPKKTMLLSNQLGHHAVQ